MLVFLSVPLQFMTADQTQAASPGKIRWAYYVPYDSNSLTSLRQALPNLDYVSPFWFYIDGQGQIPDKDEAGVTSLIKSGGVKILPTFRNQASYGDFHGVLSDATLRKRAIGNILRLVEAHKYDGVNIDFEAIDPSDRPNLTGFMAELAATLRPKGKLVTQAIPAKEKEKDTGWAGAFDYAGLAPHNDLVLLMAYSYRTSNSTVPGSTAPLDWVEATVAYAASQIPAQKLLLGVPWYGYDWNTTTGPPAHALRYPQTMELAARFAANPQYDEASQSAFLNYIQDGQNHQVWYEDQRSLMAKLELVKKYNLAGVGGWRLGHEDPGVWDPWKARLAYRTWYLAEGCTCQPFDTWILLMNPNESPANVTVTFMKEDGSTLEKRYKVAPKSRFNLFANQVVPGAAISTRVDSDVPVFVERSMYFGHDGHNTPGVNGPERTWYLAEGYTGPGTDTWVLIMNPNPQETKATVTFMKEDGGLVERTYTLAPTSRRSIYANEVVPNASFSTRVVADQPVVVERAMYFGQGGG
ncbi:MAG: glycosyl hydrolase family 18 protein, partial [Dehalococcoidia bacterium]|nr:glycosyl hydrolase family 18 protein [Dehalococcoidia bacterium]